MVASVACGDMAFFIVYIGKMPTKLAISMIKAMAINGQIGCLSEVVASAGCGIKSREWCRDMAFLCTGCILGKNDKIDYVYN